MGAILYGVVIVGVILILFVLDQIPAKYITGDANANYNDKPRIYTQINIVNTAIAESSDKNRPYYILSCEGGGARSVATLSYLLQFERHMKSLNPDFKIYKYFDMYAGSSAGAIIVAMIVYLNLEISDIIEHYNINMVSQIFDKTLFDVMFNLIQFSPKYDGKNKLRLFQQFWKDTTLGQVPNGKHILIPTYNATKGETYLYSNIIETADQNTLVSDIVHASTSASAYFPPYKIKHDYHIDASVSGLSNPTLMATAVAYKLLADSHRPIIVLNTGTGSTISMTNIDESTGPYSMVIKNDILGLSINDNVSELQLKYLIGQENILRVNETYKTYPAIDSVNPSDWNYLYSIGQSWWDIYKRDTMMLFKAHPFR